VVELTKHTPPKLEGQVQFLVRSYRKLETGTCSHWARLALCLVLTGRCKETVHV